MVARRTVEYVLRELELPQGGFYCGQDADSEGIEGNYYVSTPAELQDLLSEDSVGVDVTREQLHIYRLSRISSIRTIKSSAWNGLMIAAFAKAGLILENPHYLETAGQTVAGLF